MSQQGVVMSVGPVLPGPLIPLVNVRQLVTSNLRIDLSTAVVSPVFATIFSVPFTPVGSSRRVRISFTASIVSTALVSITSRLSINGTPVAGSQTISLSASGGGTVAIAWTAILLPGVNTILVEFAKIPGSGAGIIIAIAALSSPGVTHAAIAIEEFDP